MLFYWFARTSRKSRVSVYFRHQSRVCLAYTPSTLVECFFPHSQVFFSSRQNTLTSTPSGLTASAIELGVVRARWHSSLSSRRPRQRPPASTSVSLDKCGGSVSSTHCKLRTLAIGVEKKRRKNARLLSTLSLGNFLYSVSRKRPFSAEAQIIGLSYTVEKGLFRLNFFRLRIPTGGSSRKIRLFRLDPAVEKVGRKSFTRVF